MVGVKKQMTLTHQEFIRRFSLHILPKRFVKIRHYGFLSSTWKRQKLRIIQEKLLVTVLEKVEKKPFLPKCPCCKTGKKIAKRRICQPLPTIFKRQESFSAFDHLSHLTTAALRSTLRKCQSTVPLS